jgi:hypothetical protein
MEIVRGRRVAIYLHRPLPMALDDILLPTPSIISSSCINLHRTFFLQLGPHPAIYLDAVFPSEFLLYPSELMNHSVPFFFIEVTELAQGVGDGRTKFPLLARPLAPTPWSARSSLGVDINFFFQTNQGSLGGSVSHESPHSTQCTEVHPFSEIPAS